MDGHSLNTTGRAFKYKPGQFSMIPMAILTDERFRTLNSSCQIVLIALLMHYNQQRKAAWPTQETLSTVLGLCKRSVQAAVSSLRNAGIIETEYQRIKHTTRLIYRFPILDRYAHECSPQMRTDVRGCSAPSKDRSAQALSSDAHERAHITNKKQNKKQLNQNERNNTLTKGDIDASPLSETEYQVKLLIQADLSESLARQYAGRWPTPYVLQLIENSQEDTEQPWLDLESALKAKEDLDLEEWMEKDYLENLEIDYIQENLGIDLSEEYR